MEDNTSGEELVVTAGAVSLALAKSMDLKELTRFCELIGLIRHNLDIIRFRRFIEKKVDK